MIDSIFETAQIQFWQISLLFVVVFFVTMVVRNKRPHLALLLWILFFIKCLVPPVVLSPVGIFAWYKSGSDTQVPENNLNVAGPPLLVDPTEANSISSSLVSPNSTATGTNTTGIMDDGFGLVEYAPTLVFVWALGVAVSIVSLTIYYWSIRRKIFRQSSRPPSDAIELANAYALAIGIPKHKFNVVVSDSSIGPLVFGFIRPTIVMPASLMDSSLSMKPVLAHEICHIWRRDHLLSLLQLVVQVVFWFHPFVWLASRHANRLCEICCDDDTIRAFDLKSKSYARGLLDVLDFQRILQPIRMAPGIRPVEITRQRIQSIVKRDNDKGFRRSYVLVMCLLLAITLPASGTSDWAIGLNQDFFESNREPSVESQETSALNTAELAAKRSQLDGLLGTWDAHNAAGVKVGVNKFTYENSGNMLKEDWIATNGATAQGISYYDPNLQCWRMTWVNSRGMITESSGVWENGQIGLQGQTTTSSGKTFLAQTTIRIVSENEFRALFRSFDSTENKWGPISVTKYYRQQ